MKERNGYRVGRILSRVGGEVVSGGLARGKEGGGWKDWWKAFFYQGLESLCGVNSSFGIGLPRLDFFSRVIGRRGA